MYLYVIYNVSCMYTLLLYLGMSGEVKLNHLIKYSFLFYRYTMPCFVIGVILRYHHILVSIGFTIFDLSSCYWDGDLNTSYEIV